jgi:hypothetical protein
MIISHTNKFIFFKAPKVAGTSTEIFFEQFCDKDIDIVGWRGAFPRPENTTWYNHKSPLSIKNTLNNQNVWNNYFKFGNVRNPWDRMVSSYFFKKELLGNPSLQAVSFEDYVKNHQHLYPVSFYTFYSMGELQEDYKYNMYFIRYENLYQDISKICDILNLKPKHNLAHIHKTKRSTDYRTYYNKETKQIIEKRYGHDIRLFNYTY